MKLIRHRFIDHQINPETETLIIGTFNPDSVDNRADFFYSRGRNYLWCILPNSFKEEDLKKASKEEKLSFVLSNKIDFIDLISEVEMDKLGKTSFYDGTLDKGNIVWRDVISEIEKLKNLKRVCFSRKTFSDIPKMKVQIEGIEKHCIKKGILFKYLITPARYYNNEKQEEWTKFLLGND